MPILLKRILLVFAFFFLPLVTSAQEQTTDEKNTIETPAGKEVVFVVGDIRTSFTLQEIQSWKKTSVSLKKSSDYIAELENLNNCLDQEVICGLTQIERERVQRKLFIQKSIDSKKRSELLNEIDAKVYREPVDAKFVLGENSIVETFAHEQPGQELAFEESMQIIQNKLLLMPEDISSAYIIDLPIKTLQPKTQTSDVNDFGIATLIGEATTNFSGSTLSRIYNIEHSMKRFQGKLIAPGEEFSFTEILGPVDGEHGYKPELVIRQNKTQPEFGGGICQVSTTLFRAAVYTGLDITERHNHSYAVSYYKPTGFDATVYVPKPDLRFVNNTPSHILIQSSIDTSQKLLTFQIYGTNDGRSTEVTNPVVTERRDDGSFKTSFTQTVKDQQGNTLIQKEFRSFYRPADQFPQVEEFQEKPSDWSQKQWRDYLKSR